MTTNLSKAAKTALINVGSSRQGTYVYTDGQAEYDELQRAGLVGVNGGLTRKGTIARDQIVEERLDDAFGWGRM